MSENPFSGRKAAIVGLGVTGVAAARKLSELGAGVAGFDEADTEKTRAAARRLEEWDIRTYLRQPAPSDLERVDLVVVSPGVPPNSPSMVAVKAAGVEVISEIELAWRLTEGTIVAVTGTNGKTTTATLAGELLNAGGRKTVVAGNIGTPFVSVVAPDDTEVTYVVEVSSFQLANITSFRPRVAVLLNITPDHLNWHPTMDDYVRSKARIFEFQRHSDYAVLNFDDDRVRSMTRTTRGRIVPTSLTALGEGLYVSDGWIVERLNGDEERVVRVDALQIPGRHNVENALAATAAARACGVDRKTIATALTAFEGVEHRLEKVPGANGVTYWNDSKATNPEATIKALEAFDKPVVVLLGGRNKGNSFDEVARTARERVTFAVVFGEAAPEIAESLGRASVPHEVVGSMKDAVGLAKERAGGRADVVLSPACASFDEFENFEHRGRVFKETVASLSGERP